MKTLQETQTSVTDSSKCCELQSSTNTSELVIFGNSSESFTYWTESHLVKIKTNIDTYFSKPHPPTNTHFNTLLYQTHSRITTRINSTSTSTSRLLFLKRASDLYWAQATEIGGAYSGFIVMTEKLTGASKAHPIEH